MTHKVNAGYHACLGYVHPALARQIMIRTGEWRPKARGRSSK